MSVLCGLRREKRLISFNSEMRPPKASSILLDSASWNNTNVLCPSDFDECESGDACCAQLCINYSGGYECGCQEGFRISSDGCGCDGKLLLSHGAADAMCNWGLELGSGAFVEFCVAFWVASCTFFFFFAFVLRWLIFWRTRDFYQWNEDSNRVRE